MANLVPTDIYSNTGEGKGKRNYEFLKIYVDKDHSDSGTRISGANKNIERIYLYRDSKQKKAAYV